MPIKPLNKVFQFYDTDRFFKPGSFNHLLPEEVEPGTLDGKIGKGGPFLYSKWKMVDGVKVLEVPTVTESEICFKYRDYFGHLPGLGWYTPTKKGAEPILVYMELLHRLLLLAEPVLDRSLKVLASSAPTPSHLRVEQVDFMGRFGWNSLARLSPREKKVFKLYMRDFPEHLNWIDCWQHSRGFERPPEDRIFWNKVLIQQKWEREEMAEARSAQKPVPPERWLNIYVPCGYGHTHPRPGGVKEDPVKANLRVKRADYESGEGMECFDLEFWHHLLREAQREKEQMEVWSQEWKTQLPLTWPSIPLPRYYFNKFSKDDKKAAKELGFQVDEGVTAPFAFSITKTVKPEARLWF